MPQKTQEVCHFSMKRRFDTEAPLRIFVQIFVARWIIVGMSILSRATKKKCFKERILPQLDHLINFK